jgi:photosystem II stability/assembly factor-like uncharacterized protein
MERVADRARRAIVLMGLAAVVAGVTSLCYLRPALAPDQPSGRPAPAAGRSWSIFAASFGDAAHGAVNVYANGRFATFATSDGGRTWRRYSTQAAITTFLDRDHAVAVDFSPANRFGVSDDSGLSWQSVPQPVQFGSPPEILVSGLVSGPFFLDPPDGWWFGAPPGTSQGTLWRTADGGRTWIDLAPSGVPAADRRVLQLVFLDRMHGALVIAADGPSVSPTLLLTHDGGQTWATAAPAWPPASAPAGQGSIVSPTLLAHGDRLVISLDVLVDRSSGPSQQSRRLLSASGDAGSTWGPWTETPLTFPVAPMTFDDSGGLVLADGTRLWFSADLGHTWQPRTVSGPDGQRSTLLSARGGMLLVARLAVPGSATRPALLCSVDGGSHWREIALPPVSAS